MTRFFKITTIFSISVLIISGICYFTHFIPITLIIQIDCLFLTLFSLSLNGYMLFPFKGMEEKIAYFFISVASLLILCATLNFLRFDLVWDFSLGLFMIGTVLGLDYFLFKKDKGHASLWKKMLLLLTLIIPIGIVIGISSEYFFQVSLIILAVYSVSILAQLTRKLN